jgi:hypothetical protein
MPPKFSTSTSTAYPKNSPARTTIKNSSSTPLPFGFNRAESSTTVNGVLTSKSVTTSQQGGGGGGILGPLLIIGGVFMLWIVFRGKSGAMWNAITGNSGFSADLSSFANSIGPLQGSSSSSKTSAPVTGNQSDSGTHMGIDPSGNIVVINKAYGNMSAAEQDAANNYAHQIGNI